MLPTSTRILKAVEAELALRDKSIEYDPAPNRVLIEVVLVTAGNGLAIPVKVRYSSHGADSNLGTLKKGD